VSHLALLFLVTAFFLELKAIEERGLRPVFAETLSIIAWVTFLVGLVIGFVV
jgi:hypothetical protein